MTTRTEEEQEQLIEELAEKETPLKKLVAMTNFLKKQKFKGREAPNYEDYKHMRAQDGQKVPPKEAYEFAVENIYRKLYPMSVGQPREIWLLQGKKVQARFLRNFGQYNLFLLGDWLVMTCPTFFELVSGDTKDIFAPLFKKS